MRAICTLLILIGYCATALCGDLEIVIIGDDRVSASEIRYLLHNDLPDSALIDSVSDLYYSKAYPAAIVSLVHGERSDTLIVTTGNRYSIGDVSLSGDTMDVENVFGGRIYRGVAANRKNFDGIANSIIDYYGEGGYPFVQVSVSDMSTPETGVIDLELNIVTGPETMFDTCRILGADPATAKYLKRISSVKPRERFNAGDILESIRIFRAHRFLSVDDSAYLDFRDDYTVCVPVFRVRQLPTNLLEGSIGYQPAYGNQSAYVRGFARIELENLFGRGRRISFRYNKKNPISHEVALGYYQPNLFYQPLSVSTDLEQLKFDSLYQKLSAQLTLEYGKGRGATIRLSGGWGKYTPLGSVYRGVVPSRRWWWGLGSTAQNTQSRFSQRVDLDIEYGIKQQFAFAGVEPADTRITDTRLRGSYVLSMPLLHRLQQKIGISGAGIVTDEDLIPPSDLLRLGGARNLRGYREDQFLCSRYALFTLQPELTLAKNARFHIFGDGAWFRQSSPESFSRFGVGGGFEFGLSNGKLLMDVAWGKNDSLGDGKLYATLESRF
ncbi:MAG: hypothetical protein KKG33_07295 [candidate division Zixibacteria bacterium]|nr:hypothetical protein [candidate division Zixibacteria bacterium]MBU1469163.1 hypothetical protein [candidate division Zixibacteria bacterium]MBU2625349.1 hypothetical protein [candidate division Zixibacteria bacterium]